MKIKKENKVKVEVKWDNKWYEGYITKKNKGSRYLLVHYQDKSKWYVDTSNQNIFRYKIDNKLLKLACLGLIKLSKSV